MPVVPVLAQQENRFEISKNLDILNALVKEVELFYVDSIDIDQTVRRGVDAMLKGLDPYTEYIPEKEMASLNFITTGEYGGVGAYIRQREQGGVVITEPFEGMPAEKAGLKAGDYILAIDTTDVSKFSSDRVSDLLKGVPNSKITIKVQRPGEKKLRVVEFLRKQVVVDQVTYYGVKGDQVGYIYLQGFTNKSAQEVKSAFEDLKNNHQIKSLILDLRNNGGGVLDAAVQIVNMFVPKGKEVLSTRGKVKQWDRVYRTSTEPIDTVIPIAVLINGGSASASEILSGALQDMDRAVLVGQRSFGKGLVQTTRDLPYEGKLKVTMAKYYIPSGRCIQQLDYTHRNADGSVGAIPDSLTTVFKTAKGRLVRDGGGVSPDFEVKEEKLPTMMYYLMTGYTMFDFVTEWVQKHPTIAPADQFEASDADFESFKAYAKEKNFTYDRQSEKALTNLKEIAELEGYADGDSTLFKALEAKLTPDLDRDFDRNKEQIKKLLNSEIVKRYYFQRGELINSLRKDETLEKALSVLADQMLYTKTLGAPVQGEQVASNLLRK